MKNTKENDSPEVVTRRKHFASYSKKKERGLTNLQYSKTDNGFIKACEEAETPATARQASKYRNKQGKAYQVKHNLG